jgi:hypothetical protein
MLSCVLYANRYAETKIGGLTALFEQRLGLWLESSVQSTRECVYDPFCTDEGPLLYFTCKIEDFISTLGKTRTCDLLCS